MWCEALRCLNSFSFHHYYLTRDNHHHTGHTQKKWIGFIFSFFDGITIRLQSRGGLSCSSTVGQLKHCLHPSPALPSLRCVPFEVRNWRMFFPHFFIILMGSEWAPLPQKDAHGQNQIVLVKERVKMSPLNHIPGNSRVILKGVVFKIASVA